jgi:hypothetical protein
MWFFAVAWVAVRPVLHLHAETQGMQQILGGPLDLAELTHLLAPALAV